MQLIAINFFSFIEQVIMSIDFAWNPCNWRENLIGAQSHHLTRMVDQSSIPLPLSLTVSCPCCWTAELAGCLCGADVALPTWITLGQKFSYVSLSFLLNGIRFCCARCYFYCCCSCCYAMSPNDGQTMTGDIVAHGGATLWTCRGAGTGCHTDMQGHPQFQQQQNTPAWLSASRWPLCCSFCAFVYVTACCLLPAA